MKKLTKFPILFFMLFVSIANSGNASSLYIAVAANFTSTFNKLKNTYERDQNTKIKASFGSTGVLYAQICNGAPFDLFLSADSERPNKLITDNLAIKESSFIYAQGRLALWSNSSKWKLDEAEILRTASTSRVAIANPKLAPYGRAAIQTLSSLDMPKSVYSSLIKGQNIAQTYQFVASGNVDFGIVALSQIFSLPPDRRGVYWSIPEHHHQAINQQAVILTKANNREKAEDFLNFLKSEQAIKIIQDSGYNTWM